ncbi:MAG: MTH1187 family thiamine-binding protein [Candidatus Eisenbacteria sp.]|nr:MTH1187 family thiamine-binding protein [Candidatus Eisenbacteria bacterium]
MAVVEFSIVPVGTGSPSVGSYVVNVTKMVKASGIKHQLTPMSTILEGDMDEILNLIARIHKDTLTQGVQRVLTSIKIDDRSDKPLTMEGKVQRVEKGLQK